MIQIMAKRPEVAANDEIPADLRARIEAFEFGDKDQTSATLRTAANQLADAARALTAVADRMDRIHLPALYNHAASALTTWIPNVRKWVATVEVDADTHCGSWERGDALKSDENKKKAAAQRERAAEARVAAKKKA